MDKRNEQFLTLLRAALSDTVPELREEPTPEEWKELITLAQEHQILPLIYEAIGRLSETAVIFPLCLLNSRYSSRLRCRP